MIASVTIEKALAKLHGIKPEAEETFASRVRSYKRIGIIKGSGGRGLRLSYGLRDVEILVFVLGLSDWKIDPSIIRDFVTIYRDRVHEAFEQVRRQKRVKHKGQMIRDKREDIYAVFVANFWASPPTREEDENDIRMRWLEVLPVDKLGDYYKSGELHTWLGNRVGTLNLSGEWYGLRALLPQLDELVAETAKTPEAEEVS